MNRTLFFVAMASCIVLFCMELQSAEFYVAPNGSPDAVGTKSTPFSGIERALDAIRKARKDGSIKPNEAVVVNLASGKYFLNKTLELKKEDSGTENAPLIFRSQGRFEAELIGGIAIADSAFKKVDDPTILERIDASVRDEIRVADLNSLNIPNMKEWADNFRGRPNAPPELFLDEEPMTVARWPNEGWTGFKTTLDNGLPHDEKTEETNQKAAEKAGVKYVHPRVDTTKRHGGAFVFDEVTLKVRDSLRFARWKVDQGVWLCGYWTHDWSDEVLKVASIDTENKALTLLGQHGYGIGESSWAGYSERRYFVLNLLEELDVPGEWYLDRKTNQLYFYPPKDLKNASIILSTMETPLVLLDGAEYIQFQNLSFGPTFGGGIDIRGGTQNAVLGCRILNTGRHGIQLGGKSNLVHGCDIYNIGSVGVAINGGDRKTLTPGDLRAVNNHVHHFGRLNRTYAGAFSLNGCGNVVRNNKIHSGPHLAISYGGNENQILRNEIFDVVQETSDAGALYTGRDWTTQGNLIEENFIHHLGTSDSHGTMGVYLDDCDSGDTIRRNLFYKASRAVFIGGGRDNIVTNNLFVECYQGIALDSRGMTWEQWNSPTDNSWQLERKAKELDYQNPPWSVRYPKLAATMENEPKAPLGCVFEKNITIDCTQWMSLDGNVLKLLERTDLTDNIIVANNLVISNNGKLFDARLPEKERELQKFVENVDPDFVDIGKLDFRFKKNSAVQKVLPKGFEPISLDAIGTFIDQYRAR